MEQMIGTTPSLILLVVLVVSLSSVMLTLVIVNYKNQIRWMRIFSEKQGIPAITMERIEPKPYIAKTDTRRKLSVPIPGGDMYKQSEPRKIG